MRLRKGAGALFSVVRRTELCAGKGKAVGREKVRF